MAMPRILVSGVKSMYSKRCAASYLVLKVFDGRRHTAWGDSLPRIGTPGNKRGEIRGVHMDLSVKGRIVVSTRQPCPTVHHAERADDP